MACLGLATSDAVLSMLTPGYDMVAQTSSQIMSPDARYSTLARVILGLYAVLLVPFGVFLHRGSERNAGRLGGTGWGLAVSGVWVHIAAALIGAVALNDSPDTLIAGLSANRVHDMSALVMFAAGLVTVAGFAAGYDRRGWVQADVTYVVLAVLTIVGSVFVLEAWTAGNGVLERVLGASFMSWMVVTGWSKREAEPRLTST